jgi:CheY-like chemotaxis protein
MTNESKIHRILIVEDDQLIKVVMKYVFEKAKWSTLSVTNGVDAIEAWENGNFDLILMDLRMTSMGGIETTMRIREIERQSGRKHTPIIAFTAMVTSDQRKECLEAGFDDFIGKPTKSDDIINTIKRHLSGSLS